jgi:hypothetical protein
MFLINAQGGSGIPSFGAFDFWESELGRWPPDGKPAGSAAYKFRMRAVLTRVREVFEALVANCR